MFNSDILKAFQRTSVKENDPNNINSKTVELAKCPATQLKSSKQDSPGS